MTLRISFDLDDSDLRHFQLIMQQARSSAERHPPEEIIAAAEKLLATIGTDEAPGFIVDRIDRLRLMIKMISDVEWRLPADEVARVINALAYFSEPDDLIPDGIPGVGFLDDAIMVELVVREMRHELEAYEDFCRFRAESRENGDGSVSRDDWLDKRRQQLQSRMRRRRSRMISKAGSRLFD